MHHPHRGASVVPVTARTKTEPLVATNQVRRPWHRSVAPHLFSCKAAAEASVGCILINIFPVEQEGWRMNGFYEPTEERQNGRRVYVKHGDASLCLEFYKGFWRLKLSADKGKPAPCFATCTNDFEYLQA